jgi:hypothetical protein
MIIACRQESDVVCIRYFDLQRGKRQPLRNT